ncbi:uncharacterized protein N7483_007929 [Penicillium malachiteum]|uniref:uncharacterized protein n=1 Tax=Penicillium malachiteum TaxID=1324776 RepID=UPI0025491BA2|nr:uncharacterized protein N7483_007929 [Penicillium malachiteum]KAJ5726572.1 hypothetical protein N7483_007929 [Penicillium malachiteum]
MDSMAPQADVAIRDLSTAEGPTDSQGWTVTEESALPAYAALGSCTFVPQALHDLAFDAIETKFNNWSPSKS